MTEAWEPTPDELREFARQRLEIIDAMATALDRRDELLQIVGESESTDDARERICAQWGFTDVQAIAALDLQVRRFAIQQRRRIDDERAELRRVVDGRSPDAG